MRKTFKYRIYPTQETERKLFWTLTRCRELYNAALSERKDAYKYAGKRVNYYDQQNDLPEIKAEIREEYQDIAAHVLQDVLRRLDKAFQNFFRRCKNGENPGYPRFQGHNRYDSFTYPDGAGWKLTIKEQGKKLKGTLHLTKIGESKIILHRPIIGKIKTVTIKREVDEWYVTFSCEVEESEKLPTSYEDVGIDLGVPTWQRCPTER
jgi:putative transposase